MSADAMSALMNYRWPGNVRELEHAVERAVILSNGTTIRPRDLPPEVTQKRAGTSRATTPWTGRRRSGVDRTGARPVRRRNRKKALRR